MADTNVKEKLVGWSKEEYINRREATKKKK